MRRRSRSISSDLAILPSLLLKPPPRRMGNAVMTGAELRDTVQASPRDEPAMLRSVSAVFALLCQLIAPATAQDAPRSSECLAMSGLPPRATPVSLRLAAGNPDEVA